MGGGYKTEGKGDTLTVTARVSNDSARYAMPSPNISDFVYAGLLYKDGESPENPSSEDFVKGEPNSDKLVFSFQRPDETDGLTLEVFAFKAGTTDFSKEKALLSGTKTGLKVNGDKIEVVETIALSAYTSSTEKGTVSLKIEVPDDCLLTIDDTTHFAITDNAPNFTITQNGTDIFAGVYKVTFTVKKGDEILHIFTENINVFPGMCTDTWGGLAQDEAKEITQSMISSTVYVRGTDAPWYASYAPDATASDENSGSYLAPLATIQKAVDTIIARNDGTSEYTICVDGTLKYDTNTYIGTNGMADFSSLTKNLNLTIKALSGTATLDGGARFGEEGNVEAPGINKRIIYANHGTNGKLTLTLEKLVITGGDKGGVYVSSNNELTMNDCEVSRCISDNGGGVYVTGGTFTMNGGTISKNKSIGIYHGGGGVFVFNSGKFTMKSGVISNCTSALNGGGVCVRKGMFTMTGGTINDCTATNQGGGVYINSAETFNMSGAAKITGCKTTSTDSDTGGGGIYSAGTLTITGGTINDCTSAKNGGGIYNSSGTLTVSDGTISNCTAEQGMGGGIYLLADSTAAPQCKLTSMEISECKANYGGGVYVGKDNIFRMSDTIISGCEASNRGGGVSNYSDNAEIKDCVIKSCKTETQSGDGGGIYNCNGTLTVTGGEISENYAKEGYGGGIYNLLTSSSESCSITLTNVKIFKNEADYGGGGMFNSSYTSAKCSVMTLNGGTVVSENNAMQGDGGGVHDNCGGLTLNGATVFQNTSLYNGGDVCVDRNDFSPNFSGTTFVGDLYLGIYGGGSGSLPQITVHPDLACASGKTVCATITLQDDKYVPGTKILQAAGGGTMAQDVCDKFAVSKAEWKIVLNDDGKAGVLGVSEIYLNSESGDDLNSGLTASNAVQTLSKAVELFDSQYAQKIMVCAEYTLPSDESENGLLDRMGGG